MHPGYAHVSEISIEEAIERQQAIRAEATIASDLEERITAQWLYREMLTLIEFSILRASPRVCRLGSDATDGSVFSRATSLAFRFRAATWAQKPFSESLDH